MDNNNYAFTFELTEPNYRGCTYLKTQTFAHTYACVLRDSDINGLCATPGLTTKILTVFVSQYLEMYTCT